MHLVDVQLKPGGLQRGFKQWPGEGVDLLHLAGRLLQCSVRLDARLQQVLQRSLLCRGGGRIPGGDLWLGLRDGCTQGRRCADQAFGDGGFDLCIVTPFAARQERGGGLRCWHKRVPIGKLRQ